MYHSYCLPLNKTTLILLHPDENSPFVVQVTAKYAGESVIDELIEFYLAHHEITVRVPPHLWKRQKNPTLFYDPSTR